MTIKDLFGNEVSSEDAVRINIYADEVWETVHSITKECWIYTAAIYEKVDDPLLDELIDRRYLKSNDNWEMYQEQNDTDIHWAELNNDLNKKFVAERWLNFIEADCFGKRKFRFSLMGINISNLNLDEFDEKQTLNSVYNRFFRSMIQSSLKKFFKKGVIVENIYHEKGTQEKHKFFDWHTIFKLEKDENLNFNCKTITFLPKSHRDDVRSNLIQLCDLLLGIYKDSHCGIPESRQNKNKHTILKSRIVREFIIERTLRSPLKMGSSYGYADRFNLAFFPKVNSKPESVLRLQNSYYDAAKLELAFEDNLQIRMNI